MSIQFVCPSCKVLIEVEDEWGGQSVACGNCQKIVTAPAESTWAKDEVRTARPADATQPPQAYSSSSFGQTPPPPPPQAGMGHHYGGYAQPNGFTGQRSTAFALTSFLLAILSLLFGIFSAFGFFMVVGLEAQKHLGPQATQKQIEEYTEEMIVEGRVPETPTANALAIVGGALGLGALITGVVSMARGERKRVLAVLGVIGAILFTLMNAAVLLMIFAVRAGLPIDQ